MPVVENAGSIRVTRLKTLDEKRDAHLRSPGIGNVIVGDTVGLVLDVAAVRVD
jgi:hypothetical protein